MKCPECGTEVTEHMNFCSQCGHGLKSVHGYGNPSHFKFRVECGRPLETSHSVQEQRSAAPGEAQRSLIVDDEEMVVGLARDLLEMLGYTVTAFTDGPEALNLFASDPSRFDLIITDQNMPKLTGLELARSVLGIRNNIPIVLFTGDSSSTPPEMAEEAGIRGFIVKPFTVEKLAEVLQNALDEQGHKLILPYVFGNGPSQF